MGLEEVAREVGASALSQRGWNMRRVAYRGNPDLRIVGVWKRERDVEEHGTGGALLCAPPVRPGSADYYYCKMYVSLFLDITNIIISKTSLLVIAMKLH